jgi:hypothetical protein
LLIPVKVLQDALEVLGHHHPVKVGYPAFLSADVQKIALSSILDGLLHTVYVNLRLCHQACIGLSALWGLHRNLRNLLTFHLFIEEGYYFIEVVFFKIQLQIFSHHLLARTRSSDRGFIIYNFINKR